MNRGQTRAGGDALPADRAARFAVPSRRRTLWLALALFAAAAGLTSAESRAAGPRITEIRAGFDGHFKVGYWTPLEVDLEGGDETLRGTVEVTVLDGDAVPSRVHSAEVEIEKGQSVSVPLFVKIGQVQGDVTIGLRSKGRLIATRRYETQEEGPLAGILPAERRLIVAVGTPLTEADEAHFQVRGAVVARETEIARLPTSWWGFEGVDLVVVGAGDSDTADQLAADDDQLAALEQWVEMGGQVILSLGAQAEKVAKSSSPLARLLPGRLAAMVPLYESTMLETYADAAEPIDTSDRRFSASVPQLAEVRGKIEAYAGKSARDLPFVVRTPHGFGEVVFIGFDLGEPPLSTWPGRPQLFDRLWPKGRPELLAETSGALGEVTTLGFDDIAGQLRAALDQFTGVSLVPFWLVAALVVVYVAITGPLDYYLVHRLLRRPEATWVTLAVTVIAFSAGAYALAYGLKGRQVRVNQVDLVDFDAATSLVRGTSWASLFNPATTASDLALVPSLPPTAASGGTSAAPQTLFSWQGLPGAGFGGMNNTAGAMPLFTRPYDFDLALDRLDDVPIAIWSSKAFVGRWFTHAPGPVQAELTDDVRLAGRLSNHLDGPLEDCVLFFGRWAYPLRTLAPGAEIEIDAIDPQTIDTYLRHVTMQGDRAVAAPYDRASFDIPRIIELMSAHELAGGKNYTTLAHQYQGFVDLSKLVRDGRAVLIGRATRPATRLVRDGQPLATDATHWTFYRFVFPVARQSGP